MTIPFNNELLQGGGGVDDIGGTGGGTTCPSSGTFLGCGEVGVAILADGNCGQYSIYDIRCGFISNTPTPTPSVPIVTSGLCQTNADCSIGYECDLSNPTYLGTTFDNPYGVCTQATATQCPPNGSFIQCTDVPGIGLFAGGESPPGQPCNVFRKNDSRCGQLECPAIGTFMGCTGLMTQTGEGIAEFSNGLQYGTCTTYTAIDSRCTPSNKCDTTVEQTSCGTLLGDGYIGVAVREVNVLVNGQRTPTQCIATFPDAGTGDWDTSQCRGCPSSGTFIQCVDGAAILADGACGSYGRLNDPRCTPTPTPSATPFITPTPSTTPSSTEVSDKCVCYNVSYDGSFNIHSPTAPSVTYTPCGQNTPITIYFDLYTAEEKSVCARIAYPVTGTQFALVSSIGADCTTNPSVCTRVPNPTPTPTPSITPTPSVSATPVASPHVSPPIPSPTPTPNPTPVGIYWRNCITGDLVEGVAPTGYRETAYTGAGGGTCWEPYTTLGFVPSLGEALTFRYKRGGVYPGAVTVQVTNPSYGASYSLKLVTNPDILITPSSMTLSPRGKQTFVVNVTPTLLEKLGDGTSTISLNVEITQL